jgi:hypothetical protein
MLCQKITLLLSLQMLQTLLFRQLDLYTRCNMQFGPNLMFELLEDMATRT